ncbi:hypothetical protein IMCC1989_1085 [gamma proteobacterium IMCC1989]|nr:hypothetical protein IMCC1989_1085 [gamma proteobacterium IMCC1989]
MEITDQEKERRSALNKKILNVFAWVIGTPAIVILLLYIVGGPSNQAPTGQALEYVVIFSENWDNQGRPSGEIVVFSKAQTFEERAHTTMKAAKDYLESKKLKYVRSYHIPSKNKNFLGKGYTLAQAAYSPDSGGTDGDSPLKNDTWEVSAYEGTVDPVKVKVALLWESMRDEYQIEDSSGTYTDEPNLRKAIHKIVGVNVPLSKIHTPMYSKKSM